ncbi:MAG: acyl-CoA dehydrogenase family protein [Chloroflexi bacterium]|nr:acyl-CoA dehydrogenase family protein [Chloroflexota bacterium]
MGAVADDPEAVLRSTLLSAVKAVAPCIAACADQIERDRHLPPPVVDALHEHGLFRTLLPRSLGGREVDPVTFASTIEAVAAVDASTAWCLCQGSGCSMISAYLDHAVAQEIFGDDPRAVLAWGQPQDSRAVAVDGGYRVTARWVFASGSHHATWLGGICPIYERDGTLRRLPDGTAYMRTILFPAASGALVDVWHVSGLRGTGSDTIVVEDLFVPESYTARQAPDERREPGPLYQFALTHLYASGFGSVALGIAQGMMGAFLDLATTKTARGAHGTLRENAVVQSQVAQCQATLGSGRAYLHTTLAEIWDAVSGGAPLTLDQRVHIRLAATFATHQALHVVDTLFHLAGSTAVFENKPFERRFRDVHAVGQQVQARQAHFETVGQHLLGLEPDQAFL